MKSNLKRQVFNKDEFNNTINNNFTQLVKTPDPTFFDINLATVEDFFQLYTRLFYEIPKSGEIDSHEYLYKTSRDYFGSEELNEQIQVLLEEITSLREDNLLLREENINSLVGDKTKSPKNISLAKPTRSK